MASLIQLKGDSMNWKTKLRKSPRTQYRDLKKEGGKLKGKLRRNRQYKEKHRH